MEKDNNEDDLKRAARMIEEAFISEPNTDTSLSFIGTQRFAKVVQELLDAFHRHNCNEREVLTALAEILIKMTPFKTGEPDTTLLVARSLPICRQLVFEHKQASEIVVIISAMLTHLVVHSQG